MSIKTDLIEEEEAILIIEEKMENLFRKFLELRKEERKECREQKSAPR